MIDCGLVRTRLAAGLPEPLLLTILMPLLMVATVAARAEVTAAQDASRFRNPAWSPDGQHLALSDQDRGGVYLYDTLNETCLQITDSPSSGYAYHWSADGRRLGFKLLNPIDGNIFPLQMPVTFDLDQGQVLPLHEPVARAGVPSFSRDGKVAFTIDETLHVIDPSGKQAVTFSLGHYANLAPISPDGTQVAYNSRDDRIWVIDLTSGVSKPLTSEGHACFNPIWSPDSRRLIASTVSARLRSIDVPTGQVHDLGEGNAPSWSADGNTIVYTHLDRIDGASVNDAIIYQVEWNGSAKHRIEVEPGMRAMEACPSPDGSRIAFVSMSSGDLYHAPLKKADASAGSRPDSESLMIGAACRISTPPISMLTQDELGMPGPLANESIISTEATESTSVGLSRPVPYLHQVYDTPDDFDGNWACGASSALMAMNYFYVLDYWDITCSWPSPHVSHYGQYVSEIYTFNGYTYDIRGKDASNRWAYGGYGYIIQGNWEDTKGHMRDYIINHGLTSSVDWSPTWAKLQAEVINDDPFVLLNSLTTAGHYIVTIGYYENQHTAIFNDPYGNKNTPGYPSYDGERVMYDWPGYNNGFQNLNTVHCFIYCRGDLPPTVTQQPQDQGVTWGADTSFTVEVVGDGTLSFQWQKDTIPLASGSHYGGTASPTLSIYNATDQQAGEYRCLVTSDYGSALSDPATLTVIGPPVAPGDLDQDEDVDQEDFGLFQSCLTGRSVPQTDPMCAGARLDADVDVDDTDMAIFLDCLSGAGVPADIYCAEP